MKTIDTTDDIANWFSFELAKLSAEYYSKMRSIRIREGIARKRAAKKPFQTPARSIA